MLYEIDVNSAYIFISSACTIGFLFGLFNWYTVTSIEIKNEEDDKGELKQIDAETLSNLLKYCGQIREVKINHY
jgi:hypothetical protein